MSVKSKIIASFLVLAIIPSLSSAMIWKFARDQSAQLEGSTRGSVRETLDAAELSVKIKDMHLHLVEVQQYFTDTGAVDDAEKIQESMGFAAAHADLFRKRLAAAKLAVADQNLSDMTVTLNSIGDEFEAYYQRGQDMAKAYAARNRASASAIMDDFDTRAYDLGVRLDALAWKLQTRLSEQVANVGNEIDDVGQNAHLLVMSIGVLSFVSLATILGSAWVLNLSVFKPLSQMASVMRKLSRGDNNIDVPKVDRTDEIGEVAVALEAFKQNQIASQAVGLLRTLLNRMPIGVLVCFADGRIDFANTYARTMFDMNSTDPRNHFISQFLPQIKSAEEPELELAEALDIGPYLQAQRLDGRGFMGEVQVSPMDENQRFIWTIRDSTRRVEAEKEREKLEVELRHAQKLESLGTLAGGIAHELNTPIQFVTDNMNFLKSAVDDQVSALDAYRKHAPADEAAEIDQKYDLQYIAEETPAAVAQSLEGLARISEIVLAVKRFSYPSGSDLRDNDFNEIIRTATTVSRNQWKYVADVELDLAGDLPTIASNAGELNQLMLNLIVNAAHAIEDKAEKGKKGLIKISTRLADGGVECVVTDSGTGIKPETISKIFDPFFTTKAPGRGTGQGLSLVHSIVTRTHRGKISVESVVGEGATFKIWIPLRAHEKAAALTDA